MRNKDLFSSITEERQKLEQKWREILTILPYIAMGKSHCVHRWVLDPVRRTTWYPTCSISAMTPSNSLRAKNAAMIVARDGIARDLPTTVDGSSRRSAMFCCFAKRRRCFVHRRKHRDADVAFQDLKFASEFFHLSSHGVSPARYRLTEPPGKRFELNFLAV